MAKLVNLEVIKAELDRRWKEYDSKAKTLGDPLYRGEADSLDSFEQFLDTLQEIPSTSGTIKREVGNFNIMKYSMEWWKRLEEFNPGDKVEIFIVRKE